MLNRSVRFKLDSCFAHRIYTPISIKLDQLKASMLIMSIRIAVLVYSLLFITVFMHGRWLSSQRPLSLAIGSHIGTVWQQNQHVPPCVTDSSSPYELQVKLTGTPRFTRPSSIGVWGLGVYGFSATTDSARPPSVSYTEHTFLCQHWHTTLAIIMTTSIQDEINISIDNQTTLVHFSICIGNQTTWSTTWVNWPCREGDGSGTNARCMGEHMYNIVQMKLN
jgi:hypothetical protein